MCSLPLAEFGSTVVRTRWPTGAGVLSDRFSLIVRLYYQQCQLARRNGSPGVSIGYFQSAWADQIYGVRQRRIEDFVLCCGLVPTIPRLKSACPLPFRVRGNACACVPLLLAGYVDPRFCLRLPSGAHCCNTLAFGYPSPPSGWVWTLPDMSVIISDSTI